MPDVILVNRVVTVTVPNTQDYTVEVNAPTNTIESEVIETRTVTTGPQGPAGPSGSGDGDSFIAIAAETVGGHRFVRSAGTGSVGYVDSNDSAHGDDSLGITMGAALVGNQVTVLRGGYIAFAGWTWTSGDPVFAGVDGALTQTPPNDLNGDAFSQVVGHAQDATTLFVQIEPPVYF